MIQKISSDFPRNSDPHICHPAHHRKHLPRMLKSAPDGSTSETSCNCHKRWGSSHPVMGCLDGLQGGGKRNENLSDLFIIITVRNKIKISLLETMVHYYHCGGWNKIWTNLSICITAQNKIKSCLLTAIVDLLTDWGRVMHIYVGKLTIIGSDNGLAPSIIWTSAGILLMRPSWTNFSEILIRMWIFSFKKMHFKMSSA